MEVFILDSNEEIEKKRKKIQDEKFDDIEELDMSELEEVDDNEYEVIDEDELSDDEYEILEDDDIDDEEYEVIDDDELTDEEDDEDYEDTEEVEYEEDDEDYENVEEIEYEDDGEDYENAEEVEYEDEENIEEVEDTELEDNPEFEDSEDEEYEYIDEEEPNESQEEVVEEFSSNEDSVYPDELIDLELECIYIGLLFNNPKAISRFYFVYDDCQFSDDELMNLYKIVIFRDGEAYAPAIAKDKFQLPRETPNTYDLKLKVRKIAAAQNYNLENVYMELKKLFILKKNYLIAPTSIIQQKILEIQNYELYDDMTVEEVESALEQITVTTGLSQAVLNEDATSFLLNGDNELSNGISLPFPTLTTVFKGIRKGETMTYAMPSNSGKSRFTTNLAAYTAFVHKKKVLIISNEMSEEKMRLCLITTILNNPEIQKKHGQMLRKTEGELLEFKFRPDMKNKVKVDENGFVLKEEKETQFEFSKRLSKVSSEYNRTMAVTDWVNKEMKNSIYFINITDHTNDELRKVIMNYYYKEKIEYIFYDTLKTDTANIGIAEELKKTATILSNLAQNFNIFICSTLQLLDSTTLPINLDVNDLSACKTVKEVLDTLCLMKQINRENLKDYEYSLQEVDSQFYDIENDKNPDVRYYACVIDKNRAGAKPKLLFRINLAYNSWEELGYLKLKQS